MPDLNGSVPGHGREHTVFERRKNHSSGTGGQFAVNMRVRVYPGTDAESRGVVVEDFGEPAAAYDVLTLVANQPTTN